MSRETNGTVVDDGGLTAWLEPTINDLKAILQLPSNWNSYGARPVAPWAAKEALIVLLEAMASATPRPTVVPTVRGTVQLEWHMAGVDLEVEILDPGRYSVVFEDRESGEEWERELARSEIEVIRAALGGLARRSSDALVAS